MADCIILHNIHYRKQSFRLSLYAFAFSGLGIAEACAAGSTLFCVLRTALDLIDEMREGSALLHAFENAWIPGHLEGSLPFTTITG